MLRRLGLLTALALTCIAVAACGDDSTDPSGSPTGSAIVTIPPNTPTPVKSTTVWQISGQLNGTPTMAVYFCSATQGYYDVILTGEINGQQLNVSVFTPQAGTLDYAKPASLTIYAALGAATATSVWQEGAGNRGVTGTVVMGTDGSGSMSGVVVPPSLRGAGGASANLTISGEWTCPPRPS